MASTQEVHISKLPNQCTVEWFKTTILEVLGFPNEGIQLELGKLKDISGGYLSYMSQITLDWSGPSATDRLPKSLMLKAITLEKIDKQMKNQGMTDAEVATMLKGFAKAANSIHENECYMYSTFMADPTLSLKAPKCFAAVTANELESDAFILMEDLSATSGNVPFHEGFTIEQLKAIIDAIAEVQAHSIKNTKWVDEVRKMDPSDFEEMVNNLDKFLDKCREKHPKEFEGISNEAFKKACAMDKWIDIIKEGRFEWPVLVHGDLWTNNIMFHRNENGEYTSEVVALIDWQVVHEGQPGEDLSRVIALHLDSEDRRAHEKDLVIYYYDQLVKRFDGKAPFPLSYVQDWYEKSMAMQAAVVLMLQTMVAVNFTAEQSTRTAKRCGDLLRDILGGYYKEL